MKAIYRVTEKLTFEVEGSTDIEIFEKLAMVDKVFGIDRCSPTNSKNLKFVVHEAQGNKFYELHDKDNPKYRMKFGIRKQEKTLFPKKQENGKYWFTWEGETKEEEDDAPKTPSKKTSNEMVTGSDIIF